MFASLNARALGISLTAERTIELAAACGYRGVDLLVRDLAESGSDPAPLRRRMDQLGLRGGAWPLPVRWKEDEATFRDDLRRLPRWAALAAALGLSRTGTWVLPETPDLPGPGQPDSETLDRTSAFHHERLGAIARVLDDHGSRLGLEVIGVESSRRGRGMPFVTRLDELGPKLGPLLADHANVGILLDAFHLHAAGEPLASALAWGIARIVWVPVADLPAGAPDDRSAIRDEVRGLPGASGRIDVAALLRSLAALGYDGPVTVETRTRPEALDGLDDHRLAAAALESLRRAWPGSDRP